MILKGNINENLRDVFFIGLLIGGINALNIVSGPLMQRFLLPVNLDATWNLYVSSLVLPFVSFLLAPCLVFLIVYLWGTSRMTRMIQEKYGTYIFFLFLGSLMGVLLYFPFTYLIGERFNVPNLPSLVVALFQYFQAIITLSVNLVLTGFAALSLAYFRSKTVRSHKEKNPESPQAILPQQYPSVS